MKLVKLSGGKSGGLGAEYPYTRILVICAIPFDRQVRVVDSVLGNAYGIPALVFLEPKSTSNNNFLGWSVGNPRGTITA
jgi:hypothetical protein